MGDCDLISAATDIATAIAAVAAVVIGFLGLMTWRHELHGRADFDLARRVLRGVYEIRNQISHIRNIFNIFSPEFIDAQYERLNTKASELDVALLEAEVLWGPKLKPSKQSLKDCLSTLRLAMRRKFRSQNEQAPPLTDQPYKEIDAILYGDGDKDDEFWKTVQRAVAEFEDTLRPYLPRKG